MRITKLAALAAASSLALIAGGTAALAQQEIRFAFEMFEGDNPEFNAATAFKEYVENKTNGELTVRLFPGNQMGSVRETTEMVQQGTLQLTLPSDGAFAGFYAPIQAWSMPYLFPSAPVAWKVMDGEFGQWMLDDIQEQTGMRALAFSQNGFRSFMNNERLIVSPDDLQGMRIRTMESPVYMTMVEALGASATPIAGSEAVMALQQGVVDGLESPPPVHLSGGAADVADYMTLNEHVFGLHILVANDDWFTSLSPDHQKVITDAAQLFAHVENVEKTAGDWEAIRVIAEERGVEVHISTAEEKAAFRDAVYEPVRNFIVEQVGEDILTRMENAVAEAEAEAELYGAETAAE
ncbi:TRAP dicarboxylate transporter, DctP subunit [Oceanicola granulosus HTCC2516]|uniref:TRAP dicarboxylate transporter, DctP subunit n=1 Tax=Oceanicola granulosus (strain ATCC BAA-861 / DSM 15982 / KCTC 12143 / HTCC2516) TaxID=314256 RepID=Q2CJI4_OCEGH|nr:DctP family TRAP transporter solute-binding subunit [Oceanicola granulosus]EAR53155.1 TRAP dicarboxylate transporter, DctP subunit [Oceanicola granulosus HTCC2516]